MILIEGNIGSGKTTLGRFLSEELQAPLFEELASDFTKELLKAFYLNKEKWSFEMQIQFLAERIGMIYEAQKLPMSIMDRSIYGDAIFARNLMEDGDMSLKQYKIYLNIQHKMLQSIKTPSLLVYLKSSVDMVTERIKERARENESLIPKSYLWNLDDKYEAFYDSYDKSPKLLIEKDNFDLMDGDDKQKILKIIKNALK